MRTLAAALLVLVALPATGQDCGRRFPAVPVPECVSPAGAPVPCSPASIRLWTDRIRPGDGAIPPSRDSTDRAAGNTVPGRRSGHELFSSVAPGAEGRWWVAYNAGVQIWDAALSRVLGSADGWSGDWHQFPAVAEVLNYVADISAIGDIAAAAGYSGVGVSLWSWDPVLRRLRQRGQDSQADIEQVSLVGLAGRLWIVGSGAGPLTAWDATAALAGGELVGRTIGGPGMYSSALATPTRVLYAQGGGVRSSLVLGTWSSATGSQVLWSGEIRSPHGVALMPHEGRTLLAVVEESRGLNRERLRVFDVGACLALASCRTGAGVVELVEVDLHRQPRVSTANDFLTWSPGGWLHYGFATGNLRGIDRDRLWYLPALLAGHPQAEVTAGGGVYHDTCAGTSAGYWSRRYSLNRHGLNNYVPRRGYVSGGVLVLAAATVLDRHRVTPPVLAEIFADGFESGVLAKWTAKRP